MNKHYSRSALILAAMLLSACGDDGDSSEPPAANPTPAPPLASIGELFNAAEQRGELPKLDRTSTINGTDANANGVRDDLDAYIGGLPVSVEQKASLSQQVKATQRAMSASTTDRNQMDEARLGEARAINCIYSKFPASGANAAGAMSQTIENLTLNTAPRIKAYISYGAASDGTVLPSPEGNTCD